MTLTLRGPWEYYDEISESAPLVYDDRYGSGKFTSGEIFYGDSLSNKEKNNNREPARPQNLESNTQSPEFVPLLPRDNFDSPVQNFVNPSPRVEIETETKGKSVVYSNRVTDLSGRTIIVQVEVWEPEPTPEPEPEIEAYPEDIVIEDDE